jgi:hypothetical protein
MARARVRWERLHRCLRCRIKYTPVAGTTHLDCDGRTQRDLKCRRCGMESAQYGSWRGC